MGKYYIFIVVLGVAIFAMIVAGISIVGSPATARNLELDRSRLQDFSYISQKVNEFYTTNKRLPGSLEEVQNAPSTYNNMPISYTDPQTKQMYDYKVADGGSYDLCTTFSEDSSVESQNDMGPIIYGESNTKHSKGYSCIEYKLPSWQMQPTPIRYPIEPPILMQGGGQLNSINGTPVNKL